MVVLTVQVEIPAFYEKMEAWTANFEEEFVKCSTAALRNRNYLVLESAVWYYMLLLFTMGEIICSLRRMR